MPVPRAATAQCPYPHGSLLAPSRLGPLSSLQIFYCWGWSHENWKFFCLVLGVRAAEMVEWRKLPIPLRSWLEGLTTARMCAPPAHYSQFHILCPMDFHGSRSRMGGGAQKQVVSVSLRGVLEASAVEGSLTLVAATGG